MANVLFESIRKRQENLTAAIESGKGFDDSLYLDRYAFPIRKDALGMVHAGSAQVELADDGTKSIPFTITVYNEDRDGDVVVPAGCRLENYKKNPVIFFGHQAWEVPIGVARDKQGNLDVSIFKDHIESTCYFDEEDPDAMFIYGKVKRGFLNASSIAFVPIVARRRDQEQKAHHREGEGGSGWIFQEYDLTEWSIVGVPANAGAIRDSLDQDKSFISPQLQKALQPYAAKARGRCFSGWCPGGVQNMPTKSVKKGSASELKPGEPGYEQELARQRLLRKRDSDQRVAQEMQYVSPSENTAWANALKMEWEERLRNKKPGEREIMERWRRGQKALPTKTKKGCGCGNKKTKMETASGTAGGYTVPHTEEEKMATPSGKVLPQGSEVTVGQIGGQWYVLTLEGERASVGFSSAESAEDFALRRAMKVRKGNTILVRKKRKSAAKKTVRRKEVEDMEETEEKIWTFSSNAPKISVGQSVRIGSVGDADVVASTSHDLGQGETLHASGMTGSVVRVSGNDVDVKVSWRKPGDLTLRVPANQVFAKGSGMATRKKKAVKRKETKEPEVEMELPNDETVEEKEDLGPAPHSAHVMAKTCHHMGQVKSMLDEEMKLLENADLKGYLESKFIPSLNSHEEKMNEMFTKYHPGRQMKDLMPGAPPMQGMDEGLEGAPDIEDEDDDDMDEVVEVELDGGEAEEEETEEEVELTEEEGGGVDATQEILDRYRTGLKSKKRAVKRKSFIEIPEQEAKAETSQIGRTPSGQFYLLENGEPVAGPFATEEEAQAALTGPVSDPSLEQEVEAELPPTDAVPPPVEQMDLEEDETVEMGLDEEEVEEKGSREEMLAQFVARARDAQRRGDVNARRQAEENIREVASRAEAERVIASIKSLKKKEPLKIDRKTVSRFSDFEKRLQRLFGNRLN